MKRKTLAELAEQKARFIATARALGADEDEAAFKVKLGVIARQRPKEVSRTPTETEDRRGKKAML